MTRSRTTIGLCLLALLAFGVRAAAVICLESYAEPFTYEHGEIAENLLAGRGFSVTFLGTDGPTSQQAPFYPALLAAAYWLFGIRTSAAFLAVQLLQCAAGAVTCLCAVWIAWSLWPNRRAIGWLTGLVAALHPAHIYAVTHLQVAVWATMLLTLLVALALSARTGSWPSAILMGVLGGALLLVEPIFAIVMPIVALANVLSACFRPSGDALPPDAGTRNSMRGFWWAQPTLRVAAMGAAAVLIVAPWVWRNHQVHGEFVFIKSTFGYALWQGNNPISWGTDKVPKPLVIDEHQVASGELNDDSPLTTHHSPLTTHLFHQHRAAWEARHETLYIDDVLLKPSGYAEFAGLTEPQRCQLLGGRAWQFIREQPGQYARLCLQRLRYFLLFDETNPKAANFIYRVTTIGWLAISLIGLWLTRLDWRRLWPLYAIVAAVTLFHTLTIVSARFRLPIEPLTFVWVAAAVAAVGRIVNPSAKIAA